MKTEPKRKAYVACSLRHDIETSAGFPICLKHDTHLGMLSVYSTKKAAREVHGKHVELIEIRILDKVKKD